MCHDTILTYATCHHTMPTPTFEPCSWIKAGVSDKRIPKWHFVCATRRVVGGLCPACVRDVMERARKNGLTDL
jgi:hypothetical protein